MSKEQQLTEALKKCERWFADLIMDNRNWPGDQATPTLTQEMCDRSADLNNVIRKALYGDGEEV